MTKDDRQKLRDAAVVAAEATPPRSAVERATPRWELQTSNSFRRIGARGDGDLLCGTTHPIDGHPDLLAAPGVLDYIVAAQPRVVVALLDDIAALEAKLLAAREICDKIGAVEGRLEDIASVLTGLVTAIAKIAEAPDSAAVAACPRREALRGAAGGEAVIEARSPIGDVPPQCCVGCGGAKRAPIAAVLAIYHPVGHHSLGTTVALCQECGRDAANAIGAMCVRDGGWSKLEPRKRKPSATEGGAR